MTSEVILGPSALRRLQRLQDRSVGATTVAQAAIAAANEAQAKLQEAVAEACEEEGLLIPAGPVPLDIDWRSGRVTLRKEAVNGHA